MARWLLACVLAAAGCGDGGQGPKLGATPSHLPLFGQVELTLTGDMAAVGTLASVTVGGIAAYDVHASGSGVIVTVQGAPEPGTADVVLTGERGQIVAPALVTYDPPATGVPLRWVAFGASLTQGTQGDGIDAHTQILGVSGQIARAAGVFLALPLLAPQLAPPLQPSDFNPDCTQKPGTGAGANTVFAVLGDPATGQIDLRRGRVDWTLPPRNLAIGGSTVSDILRGASGQNAILEHIVEDPETPPGQIFDAETVSQIDRLEMLDPDVGIVTDLLGNDLDGAVVGSDDLHPESITALATVEPLLAEMMMRLGRLHGHIFIANMPSLTFVPNVAALRARRIAAGLDTPESFDAKVRQIDDATDAYNVALVAAVTPYANLHLVDFRGSVAQIAQGIRVGGELLTAQAFGGLLSLDGLHFTDTGYALYANVFIMAINQVLGAQIPLVDVEAVHAGDALTPTRLRAAGLTCVPPPG